MKVTADLAVHMRTEKQFQHPDEVCPVYVGWVYNDSKGRFPNGKYIYTSPIVSETDELIITENSVYRKRSREWEPNETGR